MKTRILIIALALPVLFAFAETADEMRAQLKAIEAQIRARHAEFRTSEQANAVREAAMQAEETYRQAVSQLPAVQAIDQRLAALRAEMVQLRNQRRQAEESSAEVAALRKARDEAHNALRAAMGHDPTLEALLAKRAEIQGWLLDPGQAAVSQGR